MKTKPKLPGIINTSSQLPVVGEVIDACKLVDTILAVRSDFFMSTGVYDQGKSNLYTKCDKNVMRLIFS